MKEIKTKDIQRIIASTNAQEASIEIKQLVDSYVDSKFKNCNLHCVSRLFSVYKTIGDDKLWLGTNRYGALDEFTPNVYSEYKPNAYKYNEESAKSLAKANKCFYEENNG